MLFDTLVYAWTLSAFGPVLGLSLVWKVIWGASLVLWGIRMKRVRSLGMILLAVLALSCDYLRHVSAQLLLDNHHVLRANVVRVRGTTIELDRLHWYGIPLSGTIRWPRVALDAEIGDRCNFIAHRVRRAHRLNPGVSTVSLDWQRHFLGVVIRGKLQCHRPELRSSWQQQFLSDIALFKEEGLMRSLLFGDRSHLTKEVTSVFKESGTSHLLAISGLHLTVFAEGARRVLLMIVKPFGLRPWTREWFALIIGAVVACSYAWFSGASMSSVRSALMMILVAFYAVLRKQPVCSAFTLHRAGRLLWFIEPRWLMDLGLMLSISSVACLHAVSCRFKQRNWKNMLVCVLLFFAIQTPLQMALWHTVPIHSMWVNTLIIPVFTVFFPILVACAVFAFLGCWGALFVLSQLDRVLHGGVTVLMFFNQHGWLIHGDLSLPFAVHLFVCALISVQYGGAGLSMSIMVVGRMMAWLLCLVTHHPNRVVFFDVDHGLSVLVQTQHHALLYDTGLAEVGDELLMSLHYLGVDHLDVLMISHHDADHSGNQWRVMRRLKPDQLMGGDSVLGKRITRCRRGQKWMWDGIEFEVLHPSSFQRKKNNQSCVLSIRSSKKSVLLTGDIEKKGEHELVKSTKCRPYTLVQVPHHGSESSSSPEFIGCFPPVFALVPEGWNSYGLPRQSVLSRYYSTVDKLLHPYFVMSLI